MPVVLPLHPRVKKMALELDLLTPHKGLALLDPLPFLDMITLEENAQVIITDSGGVQKEAFWFSVPCITLRDETEWVETVELGANCLTGVSEAKILHAVHLATSAPRRVVGAAPYGKGNASEAIAVHLAA